MWNVTDACSNSLRAAAISASEYEPKEVHGSLSSAAACSGVIVEPSFIGETQKRLTTPSSATAEAGGGCAGLGGGSTADDSRSSSLQRPCSALRASWELRVPDYGFLPRSYIHSVVSASWMRITARSSARSIPLLEPHLRRWSSRLRRSVNGGSP